MILTVEGTYCPSTGELYDIQIMDSTCLLRSKSYSSPDDGHYMPSHVKIMKLPR
jgi:hypothetical protein